MNEEWLNNIRTKIELHTEPAPDGLWESIEEELFPEEKKRFVFLKPETTKKAGFKASLKTFFRVASVVFLVLFSISLGTQFKTFLTSTPLPFDKSQNLKNGQLPLLTEVISTKVIEKKQVSETPILDQEKRLKGDLLLLPRKITATEKSTLTENKKIIFQKKESIKIINEEKIRKNRFTASVLTGQISSGSTQQHSGFTFMSAIPLETDKNTISAILERNATETMYTDIKHKSPVTVGISFLYQLYPKLSIGSGIVYTKLVSELQAGSESDYIRSRQTLNYVGVPIQLNYSFFESKRIGSYIASGVTFDKSIGGNISTQYTLNPVSEDGPKEKITDKRVQVSLHTMMGFQYKINPQLGIYFEPGVQYYLDNKSEHNTLFNEKPLMLNARMGLRFMLNK
jgi:hypothetical protein